MNFRDRIIRVLHLGDPDQIPFAPYIESFPSGDFERQLRNRGMGLVVRNPRSGRPCHMYRSRKGPKEI